MAKVTEAVTNYLRRVPHNNLDLIGWWSPQLETQIYVSPEGGFPIEDKPNCWSNGMETWHHIRWPKNAMAEPYWRDYELGYLLEEHAEYIGTTWWNWVNKESWAVGFDFDEITSHAPGVGVTPEQLQEVAEKAKELSYVDVIKSTSGRGLHLYIRFDRNNPPKTKNHTEHAAVARALLGKMSTDTGFNFGSHLDVCGSNMWIWGRKMTPENGGYSWVKKAQVPLSADDLPINWRDHLEVIASKSQRKIKVIGYTENGEELKSEQDPLEELTSAKIKYTLNDVHKAFIADLEQSGYTCVWVPDHHLLQTHTRAIKEVFDKWAERHGVPMKGFFDTISQGTDRTKQNCFCIPGPKGSWTVYRFGQGTPEHKLWYQDDKGWTWCKLNYTPSFRSASLALGGKEDEKGGFIFTETSQAKEVVKAIGSELILPQGNEYEGRPAKLKQHKDGRLIVELKKMEEDRGFTDDWLDKKGHWARIYNINTHTAEDERDYSEFDAIVRSVRTPSNDDAGWLIRIGGQWTRHPMENVKRYLKAVAPNVNPEKVIGVAIANQWTLVNMPFHEEHPGNRQWNHNAPQFKYTPAALESDEKPQHPHWDRILSHIGDDLNQKISELSWCKKWNIHSGKDYLLAWVACMFREPFEPLPYLFLYGEQNCGKSILHEAISLLVTGGVCRADTALTNSNDFNGELANAVLAVIDEKNIAKAGPGVYNKIKDWTTSYTISIHRKRMEVYQQRNSLHFIQNANNRDACPVLPGDTRITVIRVSPLIEEIPRPFLLERLREEAPHFMVSLLNTPMPDSLSRLRLPVIETGTKEAAIELHKNALQNFLENECYAIPGRFILFKDFYEKFHSSLSSYEKNLWGKGRLKAELPEDFPIGRYTGNKLCVGNISFTDVNVPPKTPHFYRDGGKLQLTLEY